MEDQEIIISCTECGFVFGQNHKGIDCPCCGSERKHAHIIQRECLELSESNRMRAKSSGMSGYVRDIKNKEKISNSGNKAEEIIDIDRTNPEKTTKYHRVKEEKDGVWQTVHEHTEEYQAKRRKK